MTLIQGANGNAWCNVLACGTRSLCCVGDLPFICLHKFPVPLLPPSRTYLSCAGLLGMLEFDGASKRSKPNLKVSVVFRVASWCMHWAAVPAEYGTMYFVVRLAIPGIGCVNTSTADCDTALHRMFFYLMLGIMAAWLFSDGIWDELSQRSRRSRSLGASLTQQYIREEPRRHGSRKRLGCRR